MYWNALVGDEVYCLGISQRRRRRRRHVPARRAGHAALELPAVHHHGRPRLRKRSRRGMPPRTAPPRPPRRCRRRVLAPAAGEASRTAPGGGAPLAPRRRRGWPWLAFAALSRPWPALGYLKSWPPLATVMSASMAPTINTGDIVVLKRLDAPAASRRHRRDLASPTTPAPASATRRWSSTAWSRSTPDGTVTTKGDAHEEPDPFTVPARRSTTSVLAHIPAAGQCSRSSAARSACSGCRRRRAVLRDAAARALPRPSARGGDRRSELAEMTARWSCCRARSSARSRPRSPRSNRSSSMPRPTPRFVPASQFTRPPTPDLMSVFARPAAHLIAPLTPARRRLPGHAVAGTRFPRA